MNKPLIDVFLLIGQSNALGMGDADYAKTPNSKCFEYIEIDEIIPMRKFLEVSRGNGTIAQNFSLKWNELTGRYVCFIHSAVDGSMIKNWGHDRYSYLVNALDKYKSGVEKIKKIYEINSQNAIWIQGESDAKYGTDPIYYREKLKGLVKGLEYVGIEKVFLSLTGYWEGVDDEKVYNIAATQSITAEECENLIVASNLALSFRERNLLIDEVHYSQEALNELGEELANNIYNYCYKGENPKFKYEFDLGKNKKYVKEIINLYESL
ncbi:sialate O-acetylesterase [Clostridium sp. Ade.TY]|uniref:sialate O-acetylesterase n=1 Tax=Clostridium sp. Ade.TY TaxID=1391647 RepID=UPI00040DBBBC|nr:sialate O-acetylesterase [Clostridium sp. Ade.TY]